jgi:hypothetical protein
VIARRDAGGLYQMPGRTAKVAERPWGLGAAVGRSTRRCEGASVRVRTIVTLMGLSAVVGQGCADTAARDGRDAAAGGDADDRRPDASLDASPGPDVVAAGLDVVWPDAGDRCGLDAGDCRAVAQIHVGSGYSCVRRAGGGVDCWGFNGNHFLGNGAVDGDRPTPGPVVGLGDVTRLAPWTCGLRASGEWWCWGLDPGHDLQGIVPEHRPWMAGMVQVSAGNAHQCGRMADGTARCWGSNGGGQLGDGVAGTERRDPTPVAGLTDAVDVSAGYTHSCALRAGGQLVCWGANFYGELGDGTLTSRSTPTAVDWLRGTPVDVEAGYNFTCALRADGTVVCWGANVGDILGEGPAVRSRAFPLPVPGVSDAVALRVAGAHACALRRSGTVLCWANVPAGDRSTSTGQAPTEVAGLTNVVEIALADDHDCARTAAGAVWCWGSNRYGQLGDGTMLDRSAPVEVTGLRP